MTTPSGQLCQSADFNAEQWLLVDDIVALGRARRKVLVNISSGKWTSRDAGRGRNGKTMRLVALSSLPPDLQAKYAAQQRAQLALVIPDPTDAVITDAPVPSVNADLRLTQTLKRYPTDARDAFLVEARRLAGIVEKYNALQRKRIGGEWAPEVLALCNEARCTDETILSFYKERRHAVRRRQKETAGQETCAPSLLKERAPSPRTLDNWSRRYKEDGLLTFMRAPATPATEDKRRAHISPAAAEWINANHKSCPTPRSLYRKFLRQARKHNWPGVPSESWFYRLLKSLPENYKARLRSKKEHTDKWAFFVPRTVEDLAALELICGDHSMRDVTVRLADGSLTRPWLTLWQCLRTGLLWGWHLDLIPSSRTIGLAYANGVRTFGAQPPATEDYQSAIYTDQGKDYKGRDIGGRVLVFKQAAKVEGGFDFLRAHHNIGLCNELQLEQILARGYNAREKAVERTHKDISAWEAETFGDAMYCGNGKSNKPDAWKDAWARHERLLKRSRQPGRRNDLLIQDSPFMTLDDYREALSAWITEYNNAEHTRTVLGGATTVPFDEYERLYLSRFPGGVRIDDETLALLVMKALPTPRKIDKNGIWLHQRNWWYAHPDINQYKGSYAEVRYSEDDYNYCWLVIHNGPILRCERITPSPIRNPNKQTMATIAAYKKHEDKTFRDLQIIQQSRIRGESIEHRVAAMIEPEEERVEAIAAEGGGAGLRLPGSAGVGNTSASAPARVHQMTRLDRRRFGGTRPSIRPVTVDEVASAPVDESIFETPSMSAVVNPWEEAE